MFENGIDIYVNDSERYTIKVIRIYRQLYNAKNLPTNTHKHSIPKCVCTLNYLIIYTNNKILSFLAGGQTNLV